MAVQIQTRRGTAANWTATNPILMIGELGYETDTKLFKIGDGVLAWNSLPYLASMGPLHYAVVVGAPGAESGNTITVTITFEDHTGTPVSTTLPDIDVLVSDSAGSNEPSATATLNVGANGTVLAGVGTAQAVFRPAAGGLQIVTTETGAGNRYLWIKGGGNTRRLVFAKNGVTELVFT